MRNPCPEIETTGFAADLNVSCDLPGRLGCRTYFASVLSLRCNTVASSFGFRSYSQKVKVATCPTSPPGKSITGGAFNAAEGGQPLLPNNSELLLNELTLPKNERQGGL